MKKTEKDKTIVRAARFPGIMWAALKVISRQYGMGSQQYMRAMIKNEMDAFEKKYGKQDWEKKAKKLGT